MSLSLSDLQNLCTLISNNSDEPINNIIDLVFTTLFANLCSPGTATTIQQEINNLLITFEQFVRNNTGNLSASDFSNFTNVIKSDPLALISFITTITSQSMTLYYELASSGNITNMSKESIADFVFKVIVFIIIIPVVKTTNTDLLKDNMASLFSLLTIVYNGYMTFVVTEDGFVEIYNWFKKQFAQLKKSKCCVALSQKKSNLVKKDASAQLKIKIHMGYLAKSIQLEAEKV